MGLGRYVIDQSPTFGLCALCALQVTVLTESWLSVIAEQMGVDDLPATVEPSMLENDDFLRRFHHALLEVRARHHL